MWEARLGHQVPQRGDEIKSSAPSSGTLLGSPLGLTALREEPFEPLQSVELKFRSLKMALLTALASVNRVGDLQAFLVDDLCLEFGTADSHCPETPAWICAQSSHHAL